MLNKFFSKGKEILTAPQASILSAASVIMLMIVISQIIGVLRQRVLLHFFPPSEYALFLAAFRLPDLVFEVLAFGAFSSAFIPVFTKTFKFDEKKSWEAASRVVNLGLLFFIVVAVIFGLLANHFYTLVAPGFSDSEVRVISSLARVLFAAQGFFVVSYVMTGV
jgi:putative peptidoglycan lipid II flippase